MLCSKMGCLGERILGAVFVLSLATTPCLRVGLQRIPLILFSGVSSVAE